MSGTEQEHGGVRNAGHISRPSKDIGTHLGVVAGKSEVEEDIGKLVHLGSASKLPSATQPRAASALIGSSVARTTREKTVERTVLPRGLQNEGLTCALNTLIQCLAACPPIVTAVNANTSKGPIAALRSLINAMLERQGAIRLSTRVVREELADPFNRTGIAHDIGELYNATLQAMTLKCSDTGTSAEPVTEALSFTCCTTTTCLKCQTESRRFEPMTWLEVAFTNPETNARRAVAEDLHTMVAESLAGNELNGDNKYKCRKCRDAGDGKYQDAFTLVSMTTLPNMLAIHVRRQKLGPMDSNGEPTVLKVVNKVILPSELTLTIDGTEVRYDLQSAAYHRGKETNAQDGGHYYARGTQGNQRFLANDSVVHPSGHAER